MFLSPSKHFTGTYNWFLASGPGHEIPESLQELANDHVCQFGWFSPIVEQKSTGTGFVSTPGYESFIPLVVLASVRDGLERLGVSVQADPYSGLSAEICGETIKVFDDHDGGFYEPLALLEVLGDMVSASIEDVWWLISSCEVEEPES